VKTRKGIVCEGNRVSLPWQVIFHGLEKLLRLFSVKEEAER
jgi:hypothetical protein